MLTDDEAIAFMVLHYNGNPVMFLNGELSSKTPFWIFIQREQTKAEHILCQRWFASEAEAARAYCEFYEIGK